MEKTGIQMAVDICADLEGVGGQSALADLLGVSRQAVGAWLKRGWAPWRRAIEIEAELGVPRALLIKPALADFLDGDA